MPSAAEHFQPNLRGFSDFAEILICLRARIYFTSILRQDEVFEVFAVPKDCVICLDLRLF